LYELVRDEKTGPVPTRFACFAARLAGDPLPAVLFDLELCCEHASGDKMGSPGKPVPPRNTVNAVESESA